MAAARRLRLACRLVSTGNVVEVTFSKSRTGRRRPSFSSLATRPVISYLASMGLLTIWSSSGLRRLTRSRNDRRSWAIRARSFVGSIVESVRTLTLPSRPSERLWDWLRQSPSGLVALAVTIGAGAGLGAIVFRYFILWFTLLFSGHVDYSAAGHDPHPWLP